jgi:hypothetical protein
MPITNPNVDERRYDISEREKTTPGELRRIRYSVREKQANGSFLAAPNFATYTDWECFIFGKLGDGGVTSATRITAAKIYVPTGSINVAVPPYAIATLTEAQTAILEPGMRYHELWAKVNTFWTRLSYGEFPVGI